VNDIEELDITRLKGLILFWAMKLNFDGKSWKWFCGKLTEHEVMTLTGKPFTPKNLQRFCTRHKIDFNQPRRDAELHFETMRPDIDELEEPRPKHRIRVSASEIEPVDLYDLPRVPQLPRWLLDDLDNLKALLDWWKARPEATFTAPQPKPTFTGESKNTGIRINKTILDRATAQAREQRWQTGGSLSQLVELLLWRYIGSPEDVLEQSE